MAKYAYTALNQSGADITGSIEADSVDNASQQLANQGYIPLKLKLEDKVSFGFSFEQLGEIFSVVTIPDLILFTKQFRTMLRAGISMLRLVKILEEQSENPKLKKVAAAISEDVSQGASLYEAFSKHPQVFLSSVLQYDPVRGEQRRFTGRVGAIDLYH